MADEIRPFRPLSFRAEDLTFVDLDLEPDLPPEAFLDVDREAVELALFFELDEPELFLEAGPPDADDPEDRERLVDERLVEALFRDEARAVVLLRDEPPAVVLFRAEPPVEALVRDEADFDFGPLEDDLDFELPDLEELAFDDIAFEPDFDADDFDLDPDEDADFFAPEPELLDFLLEAFLVCAILFPPFYTRTYRARTLRFANTIPLIEYLSW